MVVPRRLRLPVSSICFSVFCLVFALASGVLSAPKEPGGPSSPEARPRQTLKGVDPVYAVYRHIDTGYFKEPTGVFFDRRAEEIYVADTRNNAIAIFNREGTPLFSFDGVEQPRKVMVGDDGRIYVIDVEAGQGVKIFSYRGEFLGLFTFPGFKGTEPVNPVSMTIDTKGNLYFLDQANLKVLVYDGRGNFLHAFGTRGRGEGQFSVLADVAVDARGNIYVTDSQGVAVQVFDPGGHFLRGWGEHSLEPYNFSLPNGIAVDRKGRILVADTLRQDIKVFDGEGAFLGHFGGFGQRPGNVAYPVELEVDDQGRIYLVEKVGRRLQVFEEVEEGSNERR